MSPLGRQLSEARDERQRQPVEPYRTSPSSQHLGVMRDAQQRRFDERHLIGADGRADLSSSMVGQLNRDVTNTAGTGMNQDGLL